MEEHYYAVIMAGGGGTRLWPLSRQSRPKQMLRLIDERSLFQTSVQRLEGVFPPERILVVTVADQAGQLMEQCPEIPAENYLLEPLPRGTASVVGLAAVALQQRDPQASMAILTSDHYIGDEERFRLLLRAAYAVAQDDYLVTLGIAPSFPATGYGYIQRGEPLGQYGGLEVYRGTLDTGAGARVPVGIRVTGNRIFAASKDGEVIVLAADRKFQLLARNVLDEPCHALPPHQPTDGQ